MVRAPCCEKMGLKKGPWTPEEDRILVSYIQIYGHGNWRALPKQAGLSRCGKSCRLRWTNYLRPDIKRGNFTKEEEEIIIKLHEMIGNRWSAIAAQLPGRTDNEIKNVWHTHLKKRVNPNQSVQNSNRRRKAPSDAMAGMEFGPTKLQAFPTAPNGKPQNQSPGPVSPSQSCSDISSSATNSSTITGEINIDGIKEECTDSSEELPEIDYESFWSEALSIENCGTPMDHNMIAGPPPPPNSLSDALSSFSPSNYNNDDISFWLKVFMEGDFKELPDI